MMTRNKPKKNPGGRPTKYDPTIPERAFRLALLGLTDAQMSNAFGVSEVTFNAWKKEHPEFLKSLLEGKTEADAHVAQSLYKRALGYDVELVEQKVVKGEVLSAVTIKHFPPDTKAALAWLFNRQKEHWRDVRRMEHTGGDGGPVQQEVILDLSSLTDEELDLAEDLGLKLSSGNGVVAKVEDEK